MAFLIVGAVQLIGFTSSGIAAGSTAAAMMSAAGTVAAGSTVAVLQSIGATGAVSAGTALAANLGLGAAVGGGAAVAIKKVLGRRGGNGEDKNDNASDVNSHDGDDKGGEDHPPDVDDTLNGGVSNKNKGNPCKEEKKEDPLDQGTKAVETVENRTNAADAGTSSIDSSIDSLDDGESDDSEGDAGSDQHPGDNEGPRVTGPESMQHIDGIAPDMPDGSQSVVDECANQSRSDGTNATVFSSGSMNVKISIPGVEPGSVEENSDGDLIDMATGDIVQEI